MSRFFGSPTLGGKLTIANCMIWALVAFGVYANIPLLFLPTLIVCWPSAWFFILPTFGGRGQSDVVVACIAIGINSILWGYGAAWLSSRFNRLIDRRQPRP